MSSRFPELGEELLVERGFQVTDAFRAPGAALRAHHALHHLDVMRTPEREVLVMFEQAFCELKLFVTFFKVCENFEHRPRPFFIGTLLVVLAKRRIEAATLQHSIKALCERRSRHPCLQSFVRELIRRELAQNVLVLQSRGKLDLAKLHRLKTTSRIELITK